MRYLFPNVCLVGASIAYANMLGVMDTFQYENGQMLKMRGLTPGFQPKKLSLALEQRQSCAADCHGYCADITDVCCSNGITCPAGYACCGTFNCSPKDATCCPTGYYANPGEHCCPDSGSCPDGTTCDGAFCRDGSESGATGTTGGSAPTIITTPPSRPTTDRVTTDVIATYWQWYTFTVTWYYYSWFFEYDIIIHESTETSTEITTTTLLSVSTSDKAAASAWLSSVKAETTFPTPTDATPLPTSATSTPSRTSTERTTSAISAPTSTGPPLGGVSTSAAGGRLEVLRSVWKGVGVLVGLFLGGALVVWY